MKPMFPVGPALSEARVITAFVAATALLWAGTFLHGPWVVWALVLMLTVLSWRSS
jgi:dolichol kinase